MEDPTPSQTATVAIVASASPSSASRLSSTSSGADEGRFVPGTLVAGRYRIISLLGRGGMGEVYRATDLTLAQPVALKFLPDSGTDSQRALERFHNEVRVARQVSHPNVCRVYDVGEADGVPYISMEYVDGEDLASLLRRIGRLPAAKALEIARKICAGVAAAHDKGVIHRDLKPANIMLDRGGNVVVMDFGLAAVADQLLGAEARSGTPAYMAPEQLRGEEVTARSDIYSLGLVLYEIFTGRRAYETTIMAELLRMQEHAEITSMSSIAAEIEPAVEKAIRRCLDPEPAKRPPSALSVSAALPGGDPLAAALAAGETPSPELVAASGQSEGLSLRKSIPITVTIAALIVALPFVRVYGELHSMVPMETSAEAMASKVREYAATLGYTDIPADRKYDWHWIWSWNLRAHKESKSVDETRRWLQVEPPLQLGYRESPMPLIADPDGEVTEERPAPLMSGMIEAWVNSKGELRRFQAVPPQMDKPTPPRDFDVATISRLVGFDLSKWQETSPALTPLYAFDSLKTWKGRHPVLPYDVTVEVAAWHGRVTEIYVLSPWSQPARVAASRTPSWQDNLATTLEKALAAFAFLLSAFLAARNLRVGRGDPRGALRLAVALFGLYGVAWLFSTHWVANIAMFNIFTTNAALWIMAAGFTWLLYVGLEPSVRARWPHAMVTWSRVLVGKWRDALVCTHVLYGALLGVLIVGLFVSAQWASEAHNNVGGAANPEVGVSAAFWIANIMDRARGSVELGLTAFFALFCFRAVFKRDWIASIAAAILFAIQESDVWHGGAALINFGFYLVIFAALTFVLLRLGLLAIIVAVFFADTLIQTPGPQTLTKPYEWAVVMYPALALAIVLWAFWGTSGRQLMNASPSSNS